MKIIAASLLVVLIAGAALADPPATQPNYTSFYNCQIKAIGKGTLDIHVLRGHSGIIHPVNVDEKTEIVLLNGQPGKLSDLKVGQWVKVYWIAEANDPKQQRLVKIEPGMPSWAAQRLASLTKAIKTVSLSVTLHGANEKPVEGFVLRSYETRDAIKGGVSILTEAQMIAVVRYLALEGFLADSVEFVDGNKPDSPKPSCIVTLSHTPNPDHSTVVFHQQDWGVGPEGIKRLETLKGVLPNQAAAKMDGLLVKVREKTGVPASQPVADESKMVDPAKAKDADLVVRGTLQGNPAGPGKGGWPTFTLTVSHVYKQPKDMKIGVGQKFAVKTLQQIDKPATFYLVFDDAQQVFRLQDFSHVGVRADSATSQPADPESAWQGVLKALQAGDKKALAKVTTAKGYKSIMAGFLAGPGKELTPDRMRSLGQEWAKEALQFHATGEKAEAFFAGGFGNTVRFVKTDDGWKLDELEPEG